ncbi:PhoX family protein [Acanthopleuribacter pedis]|uniref:DUF839 domain-containing protein n=1 Tax=Acanthopleuribacter pedis TaxID=442870 RepID=A0A8J7U327_9BACT|nr:alkaline phosphatase PhoX [Acanthopleuribacter pedis]MBO1316836.1 DUF839 domain-containing protein [Acanthopleuribacter pedis]
MFKNLLRSKLMKWAAAFGMAGSMFIGTPIMSGDEVSPLLPLSSMVAVSSRKPIPEITKELVDAYAKGELREGTEFPLANRMSDTVRTIGFRTSVVAKWLDPLTEDESPNAPRFGANCDFIAYMGEGWDSDWAGGAVNGSPFTQGSSKEGWVWVNHEYISNAYPTPQSAPQGQAMTMAKWLQKYEILSNDVTADVWEQADVDTYIAWNKKQIGGSWFRVVQNPLSLEWSLDRQADNKRYDSTSDTLLRVQGFNLAEGATDDAGNPLPTGVVAGIAGDCSGGLTPWGTIITAEENVQGYYGDLETAWSSSNRFKSGEGFDPGAMITLNAAPQTTDFQVYGRISDPNQRHNRDNYGFLTEIDPGQEPGTYYNSAASGGNGLGHRKIGPMGRVRWENATVATNGDWKLTPNKPVVIYGANDRRGGRIYKFVSSANYTPGMTRAQVRALLDSGDLYVAHFAGLDISTGITLHDPANPDSGGITPTETAPGNGQWIKMSLDNNEDIAPNAAALGEPNKTVGQALADVNWNSIGGYPDQNTVLATLFTAANKLGIAELNRPEDVDYNPNDPSGVPRIYVAFTNHTRPSANNQAGVLDDSTPSRGERDGAIFSIQEANPADPSGSKTFSFFEVWNGYTPDSVEEEAVFAAGDPDNLAIGANGEVFFGTDGNAGSTGDTRSDAIYYLDLDPNHKEGQPGIVNPSYGKAFRIVASPGDSEATGPWFTPDQKTLFFNVQHPGEDFVSSPSTWPQERVKTPIVIQRPTPVLKEKN